MAVTYLIIFLLAAIPFFEIAAIIPIAIIGGVPAVPTMTTAFLGNMVTLVLLIIFVDKVKHWQEKRKQKRIEKLAREQEGEALRESDPQVVTSEETHDSKKHKKAHHVWIKYGLPGLAFLGPFLVGSHLSAFLAISFGGTRNQTLTLMTVSLIVWSVLLGAASYFGFDYFIADQDDLGFITRLLRMD